MIPERKIFELRKSNCIKLIQDRLRHAETVKYWRSPYTYLGLYLDYILTHPERSADDAFTWLRSVHETACKEVQKYKTRVKNIENIQFKQI